MVLNCVRKVVLVSTLCRRGCSEHGMFQQRDVGSEWAAFRASAQPCTARGCAGVDQSTVYQPHSDRHKLCAPKTRHAQRIVIAWVCAEG